MASGLDALLSFFSWRAYFTRNHAHDPRAQFFAGGEDPRLLCDPLFTDDLYASIARQLDLNETHSLLEIGCASGFVARGLAPRCKTYIGVDLVKISLAAAQSLNIPNAAFCLADALALPFAGASLDRVLCYNMLHNLPHPEMVADVLRESLRVLRPGGRLLAGFVPDAEQREALQRDFIHGEKTLRGRYGRLHRHLPWAVKPIFFVELLCYMLKKERIQFNPLPRNVFLDILKRADTEVRFDDIHARHPQHGLRFNVICVKKDLDGYDD